MTPLSRYKLNESWGHSLPTITPLTTFCLFLQNPNGLSLTYHQLSVQLDFRQCRSYGTAVLCLPETNVNWNSPDQSVLLRNILHKTWQASVSSVSKPPEEFLSQHQPGGTATILCDNWVSRLVGKGEDPMGLGRWSYLTLRGKGAKLITIITAHLKNQHQSLSLCNVLGHHLATESGSFLVLQSLHQNSTAPSKL